MITINLHNKFSNAPAARTVMAALALLFFGFLLFAARSSGLEIGNWWNVAPNICVIMLILLVAVTASQRFATQASVVFIAFCLVVSAFYLRPQTAAWRLQHTPRLTTQAEREDADFILTLDALRKAYTNVAK